MGKFKKLTLLLLYILFFVTYSKAPTDSTVARLIAAQYKEGIKIMQAAKANAGNDKMAQDISSLMERMMPTFERVENIDCNRVKGNRTFSCTADITQKIAGNSRTNKTIFNVYQVNGEWTLDK
ncbi:hypothetical protein Q8P09_08785 [Psychrobacter faecalis]|uniref:DUF4878 domain-containing protein n=1 Tax=Psychrobacter faecalis TaxID=180588 RepID=A0ABT9HHC2_9GAMM|nr:hypothetical protein [Psychrobacter faecalis]MDP4545170.1 hypothetical protein [Psychrobacter faecalis]